MPSTSEHTNGTTETINGNGNGYGIVNGNGNGNGHPNNNNNNNNNSNSNSNGIDNTPNDKANHPVICVFCGASPGLPPTHLAAARSLAQTFHNNSISLVYGGGSSGLMGELARTLVSLSGPTSVHGIIPQALMKFERNYNAHTDGLDASLAISTLEYGTTTVVADMHTRKRAMCDMVQRGGPGSGFIALSGGFGTMEELMEMTTWNQLGIHGKGLVVLNVDGYWDGMLAWVRDAVKAGFISEANGRIIVEAKTPEEAITALRDYANSKERFDLQWSKDTT